MDDRTVEIERLIGGQGLDARDEQRLRQALRDAEACRESRRAGPGDPCDCFCCTLRREMLRRGHEVHKITQGWR